MRIIPRTWLLAAATTLLWAAPGSAAVRIGDAGSTPVAPAFGPAFNFQSAAGHAGGISYAARRGGVITSFSAVVGGASPVSYELKVLHPMGNGSYRITGSVATAPTLGSADGTPTTFALSRGLPIAAGDTIGLWVPPGGGAGAGSGGRHDVLSYTGSSDPAAGSAYTAGSSAAGVRLLLSATIEPDADHDGYGDQTQDSCPHDATVHAGPCGAGLSPSQALVPVSAPVGAEVPLTTA